MRNHLVFEFVVFRLEIIHGIGALRKAVHFINTQRALEERSISNIRTTRIISAKFGQTSSAKQKPATIAICRCCAQSVKRLTQS
jgi:hypothetical protein